MTIIHDGLPVASLASRTKQNQEIKQGGKSDNAMKEIIAVKRDNRLGEASKRKKIRIEEEKVLLKQKMDSKHAAHKNNIEVRNKRTRQEHIMRIIVMSATIPTCLLYVAEESARRNQSLLRNSAATIVQNYYHERFIQRVIANARKVQNKLKKMRWRMILWVRTTKRRMHAQVVRRFFIDFAALQMEYVVYRFRKRVLQSQCLIKRFMECQQARRIALFNLWEKLEPDVAKTFRQRKRNVLMNAKHPLRPRTALSVANNIALALKVKNHLQGVQLNIVPEKAIVVKRALCKFHLEDQRREHNERTAREQDEKANNPEVHVRDAKDLLAGSELDIEELLGKKIWPMFRLFSAGSKARFRNKIRQFLCDEAEVREEVRKRLTKEAQEADANRHLSENRRSTNYNSYASNEELATFFSTTASDIQELRETFSLVDNNGDGTIDSNELTRLLDILGMRKDNEEIQDFIDTLTSGLKRISFADFIKTLRGTRPIPTYTEERLLNAFSFFAKGTSQGLIRKEDLLNALMSYEGKWDMSRAVDTVRAAGLATRVIDYHVYVRVMFRLIRR